MISRTAADSRNGGNGPPGDARRRPPVPRWQRQMARAVRDPRRLLDHLGLGPELLGGPEATAAAADFPLRVPWGFVARMRPGDPADPLLRQVLPVARETHAAAGFTADPLGEQGPGPGVHHKAPGLLHKYAGRVLLVTTGACAVHCRYCFRRHFPYAAETPAHWEAALEHVAADRSIREVILSGGDPLSLADGRLADLAARLQEIPHLARLRVHSRLPVVLPERVCGDLLDWLAGGRLAPVMVLHANHGNEVDASVAAAVERLRGAGVTVLNQAVLLAGVNDDAGALVDLSEALFAAGVLPYYLHLLDPVAGAAHFRVDAARARHLLAAAAARLPGYLVPKLVREVPGEAAKTQLAPRGPEVRGGRESGPPCPPDTPGPHFERRDAEQRDAEERDAREP